jgi:hypothetical protein
MISIAKRTRGASASIHGFIGPPTNAPESAENGNPISIKLRKEEVKKGAKESPLPVIEFGRKMIM